MPLRHVKGEKASFPVDVRHSGGGGGDSAYERGGDARR